MQLTGHKIRSVFERYNIVSAAKQLSGLTGTKKEQPANPEAENQTRSA